VHSAAFLLCTGEHISYPNFVWGASSMISALGNSLLRSYYRTTVKAATRVETLSTGNGRLEPLKYILEQGTNLRQSERRWRITL
jgi:hypothetical protein